VVRKPDWSSPVSPQGQEYRTEPRISPSARAFALCLLTLGGLVVLPRLAAPLSEPVTMLNVAYAGGVAHKRSESNILRVGARQLINPISTMIPRLARDLPGLLVGGLGARKGDLLATLEALGAKAEGGMGAVLGKWGQGTAAELLPLLAPLPGQEGYFELLLSSGLTAADGTALPPDLVAKLMAPDDASALTASNMP
jgi:hypothetical protein